VCACVRACVCVCHSHLDEVFTALHEGVDESEDADLVQDPAFGRMPEVETQDDDDDENW